MRMTVALLAMALLGGVMPADAADATACLSAIRAAERKLRIPTRLLMAIGVTESGREVDAGLTVWPWTVNAEGEGRYFPDKATAVAHVRALRKRGVRSIDVGCMQVNLQWHPAAFKDIDTAFDPAANVAYAARLLKGFHSDLRNWTRSIKQYHSSTPDKADAYFKRVAANLRLVQLRRHDLADMPPQRQRPAPPADPWALPPRMG